MFDDYPDVLTVIDVARLCRIGRNQAYKLIRSGRLPSVRIGCRSIRVPKAAVMSYLGVNPMTGQHDSQPPGHPGSAVNQEAPHGGE